MVREIVLCWPQCWRRTIDNGRCSPSMTASGDGAVLAAIISRQTLGLVRQLSR
jgi:hypothetical protein